MAEPAFPGLASGARLPVVAVILAVLVAIFILSTVPFSQTSPYSTNLSNFGGVDTAHYANYTPAHSGTFSFSWHTNSGGTVTFSLLDPSGMVLYSSTAASGSGSVFVFRASSYQFGMYDSQAEAVHVTGTLSFFAPLI